jgi:transposase
MTSPIDREASERERFLQRKDGLSARRAEAVAYAELGYSPGGIAKRIDSTEGTVDNYLDQIAVQYGPEAIEAKTADRRDGGLAEVTREGLFEYSDETREWWIKLARKHRDRAPDWAHDLLEEGGDL